MTHCRNTRIILNYSVEVRLGKENAGNVVTRQFILQVGKVGNAIFLGNSLNDYAIVF